MCQFCNMIRKVSTNQESIRELTDGIVDIATKFIGSSGITEKHEVASALMFAVITVVMSNKINRITIEDIVRMSLERIHTIDSLVEDSGKVH